MASFIFCSAFIFFAGQYFSFCSFAVCLFRVLAGYKYFLFVAPIFAPFLFFFPSIFIGAKICSLRPKINGDRRPKFSSLFFIRSLIWTLTACLFFSCSGAFSFYFRPLYFYSFCFAFGRKEKLSSAVYLFLSRLLLLFSGPFLFFCCFCFGPKIIAAIIQTSASAKRILGSTLLTHKQEPGLEMKREDLWI